MSVIEVLLDMSNAVKSGQSLANPETWSNVVNAKNAIYGVLFFGLLIAKSIWHDLPVSDDQLVQLSAALGGIAVSTNHYFHIALNKNKGL